MQVSQDVATLLIKLLEQLRINATAEDAVETAQLVRKAVKELKWSLEKEGQTDGTDSSGDTKHAGC